MLKGEHTHTPQQGLGWGAGLLRPGGGVKGGAQ